MLNTGSITLSTNNNKFLSEESEQKNFSGIINNINDLPEEQKVSTKIINHEKKISNIGEHTQINQSNEKMTVKMIPLSHNRETSLNYDSNMLVTYEQNKQEFCFYSHNKTLLGSFNIFQLIKYLSKHIDNSFYNNIDGDTSFDIIEKLICTIDNTNSDIKLKSYFESPFMGNIELLINLNNDIFTYENKNLDNDLLKIQNINNKKKINTVVKQFIYLLLNHTLKIIASISKNIKNDNSQLNNKLLNYSMTSVYRLSKFVHEQLKSQMSFVTSMNDNLEKLIKIKNIIADKITNIESSIKSQNEKIDKFLINKNIDNSDHKIVDNFAEIENNLNISSLSSDSSKQLNNNDSIINNGLNNISKKLGKKSIEELFDESISENNFNSSENIDGNNNNNNENDNNSQISIIL